MPIRKTGSLPEPIDRQVNEIIRAVNVIEEQIAKLSQGLKGQNAKTSTMEGIVAAQGDEIRAILPITRDKLVDDVLSGLIVESGSNANGDYVRWGTGLQVCWATHDIPGYESTLSEQGLTFYRYLKIWIYPAEFLQPPTVTGNCRLGVGRTADTVVLASAKPTTIEARFYLTNLNAFDSGYVTMIAIGRWK
jgi:hypothetical protein